MNSATDDKPFYNILEPEMTFEEIGKKLGVSKQRTKQIYNKAILKLKRITYARYPELRTERGILEGVDRWPREGTIN